MSSSEYDRILSTAYESATAHNAQQHDPQLQHALLGPGGLSAMAQSQELLGLQMKAEAGSADTEGIHGIAAQGVAGRGERLPHGDRIQAAFGRHDVSGVRAHVGGPAEQAAMLMNAQAYATGREVAFARDPDLHTAAHEAAHVVQQRGGVSLKGGVGQAGDAHERHADAVADAVVAGRSAESLLDQYAGAGGSPGVQLKEAPDAKKAAPSRDVAALAESVVIAIAEKETGQRTTESHMQTSAGVKASYPSQVQATVGWTLTTLKQLSPAGRKKFGLTLKDLNAAEQRAIAAGKLWQAVMESGEAKSADVKKDPTVTKALAASGLAEADVDRMIAFRDLRVVMDETADAELDKAEKTKGKALTYPERNRVYKAVGKTVAADKANKALGMGHVSIRSHIRQDKEPKRSAMWREDMAGWQRKAVGAGPKGADIEKAATADSGLELGRARLGEVVRGYVKANPKASDEDVVRHAAKSHNPGSANYQRDVVKIWQKQARDRAAAEKAAKAAEEAATASAPAATDAETE